jgi:hypothetical protein
MIRYFLAINRIRRHTLMRERVPNAIWAHVLAKTSKEVEGIHLILTGKPDIIVRPVSCRNESGLVTILWHETSDDTKVK